MANTVAPPALSLGIPLFCTVLLVARAAEAMPTIAYAPPPECPSAAAFRARLEDVVRIPLASRSATDRIEVTVLPAPLTAGAPTRRRVVVRTVVGGRAVERDFMGENCAALVDAATLAAALLLDEEPDPPPRSAPRSAPTAFRAFGATVGALPGFGRNGAPLVGVIGTWERRDRGVELGLAYGPPLAGAGAASNGLFRAALCGGPRPFATASEIAGSGVARDGGPTSIGPRAREGTPLDVRGCVGLVGGLRQLAGGVPVGTWGGASAGVRLRAPLGERLILQGAAEFQVSRAFARSIEPLPAMTMRAEAALLVPF